ncbi:MAG: c-type cytochrome domain-containing protein [Planctomycetaceae bacterium]
MKSATRHFVAAAVLGLSLPSALSAQEKLNFEDHVKPIFRAKCASCHNTNKKAADLDLSNYTAMMQGGGSGAAIEPGSPDNSYLFMLINHDSEPYMPPNSDKIPDDMIQTVRKWIEAGAPETSSSKVMLPKKPAVSLSVDVSAAGTRPEGPPPLPDVLGLEPVVHTSATTAVSAIATSPWAKLVAVAGQKQVVLYSSETLQPLGVLPFPEGQARVLKFSRSGALLLAGGGHGAAKGLAVVWNVRTGERIMQVGDELDEVLAADISSDQSMIALGGPGKVVRVYNTSTGELAYEIVKHTDWVYSLEFSPDSVLLATADRAGGLHVWEAQTGRPYLTLNGHTAAVNAVSWRIDSNALASASEDSSVKLWEMENGGNIKSWNAHGGGTASMEFCRDGRIVTCGRDKTAKIWDQNGAQQRQFEAFADLALQVSHCDETDRVIAGDWTGEVRVWNAADGTRIGNLTTNPPPLEARLAQAEAQIAPLNEALANARKAFEAATAERNAHVQKIEAGKQAYATAQKTLADRQAALKTQEAQLAAGQKKQTDMQTALASLQKAVPELTAATEKAATASDMMQDDAELKKVVEGLKAQVAQRTAEMQKADTDLKATIAEVAAYAQTLEVTKKQIPVDEKQVADQKAAMDAVVAALPPFDEKLAAAQAQVNATQDGVNKGVADVERWKQYIVLREELKQLKEKQTAREAVLIASLEAEAMLKEKQDQMAAIQQQIQAKTQEAAEAQKKITELTTTVAATEKTKAGTQGEVTKHQQAIPMLQAAVQQVKTVSSMLPSDAEVKASAEALEKSVAAKSAAMAAMQQQLTVLDKTIADSKTAMTAMSAAMAAAQKEAAAGQEGLTKLTAETAPMMQQVEQAKAKLAAAEEELKKVQLVVEAIREKLRPQLQVTQASSK